MGSRPNLFLSSTEGTAFYVGHALPLAPDRTVLRTRFFGASMELSDRHLALQQVINAQAIELGVHVIQEDRVILEGVQRGVAAAESPPVLGADEIRIRRFMESYQVRLGLVDNDRERQAGTISPTA